MHSLIVINVLLYVFFHEGVLLVEIMSTPVYHIFVVLLNMRLSRILNARLIFRQHRDVVNVCVSHNPSVEHFWVSSCAHATIIVELFVTNNLDIVNF